MKQNHYAYRVYRNEINNPMYTGTVSAFDMDSAVEKVITSCKVEIMQEETYTGKHKYFMLNNQRVGILIYANPEDY
jgi:hypothetical protein